MGDGHEYDPVREIVGQIHQHNVMLSRAVVAEGRVRALEEALEAWLEADRLSRTTFAANFRSRAIEKTRAILSTRGES